jgi:outer membrane lipoprotein-sorting protein
MWAGAKMLLLAAAARSLAGDMSPTPVSDPRPFLEQLERKMTSVRSVYLEFTQERRLKLFTEPLRTEGVMLIEKPDRIRWETTTPFGSILLADHQSVAQFEQTDGQWKKLKLGFPQLLRRMMEQMVLMHQGKVGALTSDFTVSVATGAVAVVTLVPKDKNVRATLASLDVRMEPDFSATREVVLNEPGGDLTRIVFRHEEQDLVFPLGTFDQAKPLDLAAIRGTLSHGR